MTEAIRPAKLADTIADHLEQMILEGSLRPGERLLAERELAVRFDVSRPSLREALEKLEQRGLLTSGRGGATPPRATRTAAPGRVTVVATPSRTRRAASVSLAIWVAGATA